MEMLSDGSTVGSEHKWVATPEAISAGIHLPTAQEPAGSSLLLPGAESRWRANATVPRPAGRGTEDLMELC